MDRKNTLTGLPVEMKEGIILHLGTNDLLALSSTRQRACARQTQHGEVQRPEGCHHLLQIRSQE